MKTHVLLPVMFLLAIACVSARADWDPITNDEKSLSVNPIDPGAGAIVLFKRGHISVEEKSSGFWTTQLETYVRMKILNDSGRDAANVSFEVVKNVRLSKVEGRTVLPSGKVVPLDPAQVFRGMAFEAGKRYKVLKTSFALPSVEPGAIVEYHTVENIDWYFFSPWIFDTWGLATLKSTLTVEVGPRLALAQFPVDTTLKKIQSKTGRTARGMLYDYQLDNLFPVREEPYSVPFRDQSAMVIFTPYELAFGNSVYPIIQKWNDVAGEINRESTEMLKNSKHAKDKAKEIAGQISDERKRAESIYRFIQNNIASSSIRGVLLSRTVDDVLDGKRGDPDEINALFVTMLREVKVDADLLLIAAKNWQTLAGQFPNFSQFSNLLTVINLKGGQVFADPSGPGTTFGQLPWWEQGVRGLVVKNGKVLDVTTVLSAAADNNVTSKLVAEIQPDWQVEGDIELKEEGAVASEMRWSFLSEAPDKLNERLMDFMAMGLSEAEVKDIVHPDFKDSSQLMALKAHVHYALTDESGPGQLLLNPWVTDRYDSPVFKSTERRSTVQFDYLEKRGSTSVWKLPKGVKIEQLPKVVEISSELMDFSHSCTQAAETVTCIRNFILKKPMLRTSVEYQNAKQMFEKIARADQEVMILNAE